MLTKWYTFLESKKEIVFGVLPMKISAQEEYGLRCLLRLSQAEKQALTLPEIAAGEGLSTAYVAKLMGVLRDAGLIDSVRGRSGGYRRATAPEAIGLGSPLRLLASPLLDVLGCLERRAGMPSAGPRLRRW